MTIHFRLEYITKWGESLAVHLSVGTEAPLIIRLDTSDGRIWQGDYELKSTTEVITYRYAVYTYGNQTRIEVAVMPHILFPKRTQQDYWQDDWWQDVRKVAGVAIPVFALKSEGSFGVGDFGDLKRLIEWAEQVDLKAVQILPINDTTISHQWTDSYPYNSISIYALHPQYLDLRQLGKLKDAKLNKEFERKRRQLNSLPQIDYVAVNNAKMDYIRLIYAQDGEKTLASPTFKSFFKKNAYWLRPYAVFSYLRDEFGTAEFGKWPKFSKYDEAEVNELAAKCDKLNFFYYIQYHLHRQLLDAGNLARRKNIILKGDIPIGISRESVEAWVEPYYFNMDKQTGAPPDMFCDDGQNWGFPTYNWESMERDGYQWWMRRMQKMAEYFSAYRIDHLLGFFRIWQIPQPHKSGLMGTFAPALPLSVEEIEGYKMKFHEEMFIADSKRSDLYHPRISAKSEPTYQSLSQEEQWAFDALYEHFFYQRHNHFWYKEAMKKLPVLTRSTQMIVCGEDLGMVPQCVPWVMNELNILSLEIQSMPKEMGVEFGWLPNYPELSVCTISSHDTPTLRGWWEEDYDRAQRYYTNVLHLEGDAPKQAPGWICEKIIRNHLECPSALCILTLQDWLAIDEDLRYPVAADERINVPSNPRHYWRYRMHITLEDLIEDKQFTQILNDLIHKCNR